MKNKKTNPSLYENNVITNYVYPKNDKSNPKLKEDDVLLAKQWVEENQK